jgi:GNAT superfamily N-acetyltransferase
MMFELQADQYARVRPVFEALRYNLVIDSVIDGHTPAWVYVDDVGTPTTAWMWNRQDAMLLAGRAGNDAANRALGQLIGDRVIPDVRRRYIPQLSLHYAPEAWEQVQDIILSDKAAEKAGRRFYTLDRLRLDWRAGMPPGYEMARLDETFLKNGALHNMREVVGWVRSFWHSVGDFTRTGFGFCVLHGESIVSWCLSVYASGNNFELGLATVPDYRNQGFASLTAAACVEYCLDNGLVPHWHCWDDNAPSIAVAAKVGFARPVSYQVFRFPVT